MSYITKEKLDEIIEKHKKWLRGEEVGTRAVFTDADLTGADLRGAVLRGADLTDAVFTDADLRGADLTGAVLRGADLTDAKNAQYIPMSCPDYGSFIGWKKASQHIVKLQIPDTALRSSATGRKCRCNEAIVLAIENYDGTASELTEIASDYDSHLIYKVGATVNVENFDENRFNECAPGIHFFINRQEAVMY